MDQPGHLQCTAPDCDSENEVRRFLVRKYTRRRQYNYLFQLCRTCSWRWDKRLEANAVTWDSRAWDSREAAP